MKSRRKAIATAIVVGLAMTLAPAVVAWAADKGNVQDLKREVSQLRADVQSLQLALADMAEVKRQQSADLTRALEESAPPAQSSAPVAAPAPAAPTPPATAAPAASGDSKSRKPSHHRRHRHSSRARSRDR